MNRIPIKLPPFHDKQVLVWKSKANEILLGGDTRSGKSFFIRVAYIIYCSQIPGLQTDIFRLHFDDVIKENMDGETSFPVLLDPWIKGGLVKCNEAEITFWNESKIYLEHCADDVVMLKHRGVARHVRTFSESTQMLEHRIRALTGWVTMSDEMLSRVPEEWQGQFPKVFYSTNPLGQSSGYFRRNFVDIRPPFSIERVGQFNRQYIPMFVDDNPSESKEKTIARIQEAFPDKAVQESFISVDKTGVTNWHSGVGEFFPEWNYERLVVSDFRPPNYWFRFRGLDLGYAEPFCVHWVAVSDGEPFKDEQNRERWFPRGAFIIYNEWYGCDEKDPSKGIRMRNEDIRDGIIARSEYGHVQVVTLTDKLPFQDRGGDRVPDVFLNGGRGIRLTLGNCARVTGWNQLRSRMIGADYSTPEGTIKLPMIYWCENCKYAIDYMPRLARHKSETKKEDAEEHGEATHAPDTDRIICMAHTVIKDSIVPLESKIARELKAGRPNMKKITSRLGGNIWA